MALVNKPAWNSSVGGEVSRKLLHCFSRRSGPETSQGLRCVQEAGQKDP